MTEAALAEAERVRQLSQPSLAESICLDVIAVASTNQRALSLLVRTLCDQLVEDLGALSRAQRVLPRIQDDYEREMLTAETLERHARALLRARPRQSRAACRESLMRAVDHYAAAANLAPPGSIEALLRSNACVRTLEAHSHLHVPVPEDVEHPIE